MLWQPSYPLLILVSPQIKALRFMAYYKQSYDGEDIQIYIGLDTHEG